MAKVSGIRLITAERKRQIEKEGWSLEHDLEEHSEGDLALAAICYATPVRIFERINYAHGINFVDPWPTKECISSLHDLIRGNFVRENSDVVD